MVISDCFSRVSHPRSTSYRAKIETSANGGLIDERDGVESVGPFRKFSWKCRGDWRMENKRPCLDS